MPPHKRLERCEGVPFIEDKSHIPIIEEVIVEAMDQLVAILAKEPMKVARDEAMLLVEKQLSASEPCGANEETHEVQ